MVSLGQLVRNVIVTFGPDILILWVSVSEAVRFCAAIKIQKHATLEFRFHCHPHTKDTACQAKQQENSEDLH